MAKKEEEWALQEQCDNFSSIFNNSINAPWYGTYHLRTLTALFVAFKQRQSAILLDRALEDIKLSMEYR